MYKLKQFYDKNFRVFHKLRGFEHALIQQVITVVGKHYIIYTNNRTTGQFTSNIRQIYVYLLKTYGKISLSHLNNFEKEVTKMHYDPVTTVDKFSKRLKTFFSTGTWEIVPIHTLKKYPSPITLSTILGNY